MILNNVQYVELMFLNVELQDITSMDTEFLQNVSVFSNAVESTKNSTITMLMQHSQCNSIF